MFKNKKLESAHRNLTFRLGLVLFSLMVVGVVASVLVPWVITLFDPDVVKQNVAFMLIAMTLGAILPALVSYIMGYRATLNKDKALRRYNGVLFGAAAFWLSMVFSALSSGMTSWASDYNTSAIVSLFPAAAALLIMTLVAYKYSHRKDSLSVLDFGLYQLVLAGSVAAYFAVRITQLLASEDDLYLPYVLYLVTAAIATVVAYGLSSGKLVQRFVLSLLTLSVGFAALYASSLVTWSLFPQLSDMALNLIVGAVGLVIWAIYLRTVTVRS